MLFLRLIFAVSVAVGSSNAANCNTVASLEYTWDSGQDGTLDFDAPIRTSSWTVILTYDKPITSLSAWDGISYGCSRTVCTYKNEVYNGVQRPGDFLSLGYQIKFARTSVPPRLVSMTFNGYTICADANVATTTTRPTTTAPRTSKPTTTSSPPKPTTTARTSKTTTKAPATSKPTAGPTTASPPATGRCADYSTLINYSMLFYEAQRSGKLPATQRVTWRKDSALNDKGKKGEDLSGGYYDAGDYVKFGLPMAYTMTVLAMGGIFFPEGYIKSGQTNYLLDAVKWGTDYFIKCHVSEFEFYGQVGDGNIDHDYWGRPEDMTMARPAWSITPSAPGSELAGETAAAMAAASILFKTANPNYSATLLTHAKQLFNFGTTYRGKYSDSIPNVVDFYNSFSGYDDELAWAALWLYKATSSQTYLDYATLSYANNGFSSNQEVLSWDSKFAGIVFLLAQITGQSAYLTDVQRMCDFFVNSSPKSPLGQAFFDSWGSLPLSANAAFICLMATDLNIPAAKKTSYQTFAVSQMEYILSKTGRSFVVGFGTNPPTHPHHASSSCPDAPAVCDHRFLTTTAPNVHVLYGALVGGPAAANDKYTDVRTDYVGNEVTMDYNAGFQGLLAGLRKKACP